MLFSILMIKPMACSYMYFVMLDIVMISNNNNMEPFTQDLMGSIMLFSMHTSLFYS